MNSLAVIKHFLIKHLKAG